MIETVLIILLIILYNSSETWPCIYNVNVDLENEVKVIQIKLLFLSKMLFIQS